MKLKKLRYSHMVSFVQCREKYYHEVIEGLEVKPEYRPDAMKLGTVWDLIIRYQHDAHDYGKEVAELRLSEEQVAKITALKRAYRDLEIFANNDGFLGCQYEVSIPCGDTQIIGHVDRAYDDHIVETKCSGSPDFYTHKENIAYQLGTYFMGSPEWEYGVMEIVRVPGLRTGSGKFSDESMEAYENRMYGDILSRPSYYFLGWDKKSRTYGIKFFRTEFDLDEIMATYNFVIKDIERCMKDGGWYKNNLACHVPAICPYLPIKKTGVVSEEIYQKREV